MPELRSWVEERQGSFYLYEKPENGNGPVYCVFCVGDDAAFEFKMRWSVDMRYPQEEIEAERAA